jgi:protein subunit release factor A
VDPLDIPDDDDALLAQCEVQTFRSGGKGGQHQNTTDSGVRLIHRPTGLRAESRSDRSQHRNRALALARLRKKLEARNRVEPPRLTTRIPPGEKRKRADDKTRRGRLKRLRRPPRPDDD